MSKSIKISFQAEKSSPSTLIIRAYINYGYREINPKIGLMLKGLDLHIPSDGNLPELYPELGEEIAPENADLFRKYEILLNNAWSENANPEWNQILKVITRHFSDKEWGDIIEKKNIFVYRPCKVTTGIMVPKAFWDRNSRRAKGPYAYVNHRLIEFKNYTKDLYNALSDSGNKKVEPEKLAEQIRLHITSKFKQGEQILSGKTGNRDSSTKKKRRVELPKVILPGYYGDKINGIPTKLVGYIEWKVEEIEKQGYINTGISADTLKVYKRFSNRVVEFQDGTKTADGDKLELDIRSIELDDIKKLVSFFDNRGKKDGTKYKWNYLLALKKEYHNILKKAQSDGIWKFRTKEPLFSGAK